jgi:type IV secretory pathway VirB2 component (pilin)
MAEAENRFERFKQEMIGIALVFLAAFLFLSFTSYRVDDPSFFSKGAEKIYN